MFDGRSECTWWGASRSGGAEEVFRRVAAVLGDRLRRIPDGETGPRSDWIGGSTRSSARSRSSSPGRRAPPPPIARCPSCACAPASPRRHGLRRARLRLGGDVLPRDLRAPASDEGVIPRLPLPRLAADAARARERVRRARAPGRPRAGLRDADGARRSSASSTRSRRPARDPVGRALRVRDARRRDRRLVRRRPRRHPRAAAAAGPPWCPRVELGYHLCYGDEEHGHFSEPQDSRDLVGGRQRARRGLERPLNWIHMPVPRARRRRWFAPMRELRLPAGDRALPRPPALRATATRARCAGSPPRAATSRSFGVATECGWGRGTAEAVMGLLELHRGVSAPLPDAAAPLPG